MPVLKQRFNFSFQEEIKQWHRALRAYLSFYLISGFILAQQDR